MEWFRESALRYRLTGRPLEELCEINAQVAADLDRIQVGTHAATARKHVTCAQIHVTSSGECAVRKGRANCVTE